MRVFYQLLNSMNKLTPGWNRRNCTKRADCIDCDIRKSALFSTLSEAELIYLVQPVLTFQHEAHIRLYEEGEAGSHAYTVRKGIIKLVKTIPNGEQRIVRLASRSDFIGLEILLAQPYRHTAISITPIEICKIPVEVLKGLEERNPSFSQQLMTRWQKNVDDAESVITDMSTGKAASRLAHLILRYFSDGLAEVWNSPARDDIASMLGVTTETASRLMAEFKREGLISEEHGRIAIQDFVALKSIADD